MRSGLKNQVLAVMLYRYKIKDREFENSLSFLFFYLIFVKILFCSSGNRSVVGSFSNAEIAVKLICAVGNIRMNSFKSIARPRLCVVKHTIGVVRCYIGNYCVIAFSIYVTVCGKIFKY